LALNIVVCIKQIPDTEGLIEIDRDKAAIKKEGLPLVVNPYDLVAVEEAVQLKERLGMSPVTVVSMGPPPVQDAVRNCLAMGADRGLILWDEAFRNSDSFATAIALAKVIAGLQPDLILCGQKALDTESGQVGAVIAVKLNVPMVSAVVKIEPYDETKRIRVHRKLEKGAREVIEVPLPALLTLEIGSTKPRYPSLHAIFAAKRKVLAENDLKALNINADDVGQRGSKTKILSMSTPKPVSTRLFSADTSLPAGQQLGLLMTGGITQKKGKLVAGDQNKVASDFIQFLREKKLLNIS
jgi:electron transfer flavoprotein beta subunit